MAIHMKKLAAALITAAASLAATSSHASLVYVQARDFTGTGLGAVNTVLTIQSPNNETEEEGKVSWNGSMDVRTGDYQNQTQTRTLGELGITAADQIRVIFNVSEPGQNEDPGKTSIMLDNLVLTIYDTDGTALWNSGAFTGVNFPDGEQGTGTAGFEFKLDALQAADAQLDAFFGNFADYRVGLDAKATDATGGLETFFVFKGEGGGGGETGVPEPATLALLSAGLLGFGAMRRRKQ